MARIARPDEGTLYQTRGRPVAFLFEHRAEDGSRTNLTGCTATAALRWPGVSQALVVGTLDASGDIRATGPASLTADLPEGRVAEVWLSLTDTAGTITDAVFPVTGEVP